MTLNAWMSPRRVSFLNKKFSWLVIMKNRLVCILSLFLFVAELPLKAQSDIMYPVEQPLQDTDFAEATNQPDYSRVGVFYHAVGGNFARPQLPASGMAGGFEAKGRKRVNRLVWDGQFTYRYQQDERQDLNNTSLHPDAQPYLWADTATGRWDRNYFDARVQLREINQRKIQWGASLFFRGGQGDRFNDPRPLYRFRRMGIAPELYFHLSDTRWVALQLSFSSFSEDNEMGFFSVDDPLLYRLRGYGTFSRTAFVSGERQLSAQKAGIALRWMEQERLSGLLSAAAEWGKAEEGVAIINTAGEWQSLMAAFSLNRNWSHPLNPKLSLNGYARRNSGTDPIFGAINARLQTAGAKLSTQVSQQDSSAFHWYLQANGGWTVRQQEDLATFTEADLQYLPVRLSAGFSRQYNRMSPFLVIVGTYRPVLKSTLQAVDATEITERLVRDDFAILSADYYLLSLQGGLDRQGEQGRMRFSFKLSRQQALSRQNLFQNLMTLSVSFFPEYAPSQSPFDLL